MKNNVSKISCNEGFTLIELLVVVLIIGILAAVAVPQYQKAVEKSRATEMLANVKALRTAREAYILANGVAPSSLEELDVTISSGSNGITYNVTKKGNIASHRKDENGNTMYSIQYNATEGYGLVCNTPNSAVYKDTYEWLCKSLGSEQIQSTPYAIYRISD